METTYDTPNDEETGAILEMCEIEVYGIHNKYYKIIFAVVIKLQMDK